MKKTTKLILLFGASMLFGALNASAWQIYYDASGLASTLSASESIKYLYISGYTSGSDKYDEVNWKTTIGSTGWNGWQSSAVAGIDNLYTIDRSSGTYPPSLYLSFEAAVSSGSNLTYTRNLINNGVGGTDATGSAANTFYKVAYIDGGVYSLDTYGSTELNSTTPSTAPTVTYGVKTRLTWTNNYGTAITDNKIEVVKGVSNVFTVTSSVADMNVSVTVLKDGAAAASGTDYTFVNNQLTILENGTYTVTAATEQTSFSVAGGTVYIAPSTSNEITIDMGSEKVYVATIGEIEWNQGLANGSWTGTGDNPFASLFTYYNEDSASNHGLTVTIEPTFETQTQPSSWSESTGMSQTAWNQMKAIEETGAAIDGYWKEPTTTPTVSGNALTDYSFPCSGTYTLTVSSSDSHVVINNPTQTVTIYPSMNLKYTYTLNGSTKTDMGLNIDGYQVENGVMTLNTKYFATSSSSSSYKDPQYIYLPGVYPVTIDYYYSSFTKGTTTNGGVINLTRNSSDTGQLPMVLVLTKNGASTPIISPDTASTPETDAKFYITYSSDVNIPTGVEDLTVDGDAAAIYYNLQGVKVANPQGGIFVKVAGGKATKVIL